MDKIDFSNPSKKYFDRGFEVTPASFWVKDFFKSLSKLTKEERAQLFWNQTNTELFFDLQKFERTKAFRFEKDGRGMYWLFRFPNEISNVWGLEVFNPKDRGISGIDFIRAIPTYMNMVYQFKDFFRCKKFRAIVFKDNLQSIRMCEILVKKNYLRIETELKNEINVNNKDRDLIYFNVV